nr:hypothetical protein [uncultured Rhodoferax sp.]
MTPTEQAFNAMRDALSEMISAHHMSNNIRQAAAVNAAREALAAAAKEVQSKQANCSICAGTGWMIGTNQTCFACGGAGYAPSHPQASEPVSQ